MWTEDINNNKRNIFFRSNVTRKNRFIRRFMYTFIEMSSTAMKTKFFFLISFAMKAIKILDREGKNFAHNWVQLLHVGVFPQH